MMTLRRATMTTPKTVRCEVENCSIKSTNNCSTCHHNLDSAQHVNCEIPTKCTVVASAAACLTCPHNKPKDPH